MTVFPDNGTRSLPSIMGAYLLLSGKTGVPLAMIDGPALTVSARGCFRAGGIIWRGTTPAGC